MSGDSSEQHELVLRGGRVVDPETRTDEIANVGITKGVISAVTGSDLVSDHVIGVEGLVVAPGWIDLHSHAQSVAGHRLQAHDGVTTSLELEAGASPVGAAYRRAAQEGRPLNYGYSTSWMQARMMAVGEIPAHGELMDTLQYFGDPRWTRSADARQRAAMFRILQKDLDDGALGIGVLLGYAPGADPIEYLEVSRLAANAGVPTFTHARALVEQDPDTPFDGASEIVRAAGETGVRAHYCHINSTSLRHGERVLELIVKAQNAGGTISTEAYPYGAGMTAISAAFLAPERLAERGIEPSSIIYLPTGEVVADRLRLGELRDTDPSALVIVRHLSESDPLDLRLLDRFQSFAGTVVASDAMPVTSPVLSDDPYRWPIPEELMMHPRNAGTFSKVLRRYVRELDMSVIEVVARCSYLPARVLEQCVPAMSRKGRIQVGCDADIVVFDIDRVSDQATYTASTRCSTGYAFVLVGGVPVVIDDRLIPDAFPGRPVRR